MAQTNAQLPQVVIPNTTLGIDWTNPDNILLADDAFAVASGNTQILTVGNFPINLGQTDTVTNIVVAIKGYRGSFNTTLQIFAIDNTSGSDLSYPLLPTFQGFDGTNTLWTMPASLFGANWTIDQINNIKIKLIADGELHLDYLTLNVIYTPGSTLPPPVDPTEGQTVCDEFVQGQRFQLAQSMTSSDLFAFLTSFNYPDGTPIAFADFHGADALITIDQGIPGKEENARMTAIDQNYNGSELCRISFGTLNNRGLAFKWPYTTDATLREDHSGTAEIVISNSAPFYDRFLKKCQIDGLVSAPIEVQDEGISKTTSLHRANFTGAGVTVTNDPADLTHDVVINIPGVGGTSEPDLDSTSSTTSGSVEVASLTWSHTCSGVNRLLVVQVSMEGGKTVTGITYNGIALSVDKTAVLNNARAESWHLIAPATGTHDIVVTFSAISYSSAGAESFVNVDQSTPIGTTQNATGHTNTPTMVLTTTYDNSLVVDGLSTAQTPILYTAGAGQIANWSHTANTDTRQGGSSLENAGTAPDAVTMSYAITQTTDWAYVAVEIKGITITIPSGVTVKDEGGSLGVFTAINFTGAGVTATDAGGGVAKVDVPSGGGGSTVKVDAADTTADYLNPKLNLHSSDASVNITKTITNPAGNEILDFDFHVSGGGGGVGELIVGQTSGATVQIDANTLGINNCIEFEGSVSWQENIAGTNSTLTVTYGGQTIGAINMTGSGIARATKGFFKGYFFGRGTTGTQAGMVVLATGFGVFAGAASNPITDLTRGEFNNALTVDSTANQNLVFALTNAGGTDFVINNLIVRKVFKSSGVNFQSQDIPLAAGTAVNTISVITSNPTGSVIYVGYDTGGATASIFRLVKDSLTGNYYVTHSTTLTVTAGDFQGMAVVGSYLFVSCVIAGSPALRRYSAADLTGVTTFTFSGTAKNGCAWSDGTDLYISTASANKFTKFTLAGTVATNAGDVTYTSAGNVDTASPICDGTHVWIQDNAATIRKYVVAGGAVISTFTPIPSSIGQLNGTTTSLFMGSSTVLGFGWGFNWTSATAVTGIGIHLMGITLP